MPTEDEIRNWMKSNWEEFNTATALAEAALDEFVIGRKEEEEIFFDVAQQVFYGDWDNNPERNEEA